MIITKCSCGFTVETGTAEEGYKITHQHFLDNINTHVISTISGGIHMHTPSKKKWYQRVWNMLKNSKR